MICRPPTPTLFPYTTLFRSVRTGVAQLWPCLLEQLQFPTAGVPTAQHAPEHLEGGPSSEAHGTVRKMGQDRKSTRLNSSHVEISYAVFCLKKKKKMQRHICI